MSFLKDFKEDLSQAVSELLPEEELLDGLIGDDEMVNTFDEKPVEVKSDSKEPNNKGEGTEDMSKSFDNKNSEDILGDDLMNNIPDELLDSLKTELGVDSLENDNVELDLLNELYEEEEAAAAPAVEEPAPAEELTGIMEEMPADEPVVESLSAEEAIDTNLEQIDEVAAEETVSEDTTEAELASLASSELKNEVTVITKGTTINGSITSDGSLEIMGTIHGDIDCLGKLTIVGEVVGNSMASEVFVNTSRLEGSINSEGSVKINAGTVVIGDITASSGVIAGAVKGQIDINGPIVVDANAVVKGNINAKSVQINNGAVIDGFCSLVYSEVDIDSIFEK